MRGARKPGTPGRGAPVRRPSGPRGLAVAAGLGMLVPVCFAGATSQSTTFLATPAASAVDLEFTPSPSSAAPDVTDVTGDPTAPALADVVSPAAEVVVPAATPSPTETDRLLGLATTTCAGLGRVNATDIARLARAAGFPDSQVAVAVAVAFAESAGYPTATNHNTNGSIDFGRWQINSVHGALLTTGSWCVPADNAAMAHTVWTRAGGSWTPWTTYNSGSYIAHLSVANQAAAEIGAPAAVANPTPSPGTPTPETPAPGTPTPDPGTPAPETPAPGTPTPEAPAAETPALATPPPETPSPSTSPDAPATTTPPPSSPAATPPPATTPPAAPPESVSEPAPPSQEATPSAEPVDAVSAEASGTAAG